MGQMYYNFTTRDEVNQFALIQVTPYFYSCFYYYYKKYQGIDDGSKEMIFGFPAHPEIEHIIDNINNTFSNISIEIILKHKFPNINPVYFFTVKLNNKYKQSAKFIIPLIMAQFVRIVSPSYYFANVYLKNNQFIAKDEGNFYIEKTLYTFNNTNRAYGSLCYNYVVSFETLMKLDNIEIMNSLVEISYDVMPKASLILSKLETIKIPQKRKEGRYHRNVFFPEWSMVAVKEFANNMENELIYSQHALKKLAGAFYKEDIKKKIDKFLSEFRPNNCLLQTIEFYINSKGDAKKVTFRLPLDDQFDITVVVSSRKRIVTFYINNKDNAKNENIDRTLYEKE